MLRRTVTNVGAPNSTYTAHVVAPAAGVKVRVEPTTLAFAEFGERKSFQVCGGEGEEGQRVWVPCVEAAERGAGEAAHGEEPHCRDVACRMKSWSGSAASWCLILQSLSVSIIATTNGEKTM